MFVLRQLKTASKIKATKIYTPRFYSHEIVSKNYSKQTVNVEISGDTYEFPNVWLRDNCQCSQCFHPSAKSRILDWSKFNLNIQPQEVKKQDRNIHITWDDGHESQYTINWLKLRSFKKSQQSEYDTTIYRPKKVTWHGKNFLDICSKHDYNDILKSDEALYHWLEKLSVYGVAVIQNTPNSDTALDSIVDKIGFTKRTHYGVKFIVQHVTNTSNVAYQSNNLQIHTDLPYYEYCPGVNMLHCLVQTQSAGGENLLSDAHYVAKYMKEKHPDEFKLLTETDVEWSDIGTENGNEFYKLYRAPVISLDKHNEITRINFSIPQRGNYFPGSMDLVAPWYAAHGLFMKLNYEFSAKFKTKEGQILVFDNIRLLHGRNAYKDNNINVRKLIGAYVDWDEIYSRLRCLKIKLHFKSEL